MKLFLGCPIYQREWSIPRWFDSIFKQGINPKQTGLVFGYSPGNDNTLGLIEKYGSKFESLTVIDCSDVPAFSDRDTKRWYTLAIIRNRILDVLRQQQPDYYMSWDSDILLPEGTLKALIKDKKDMVSPYVDLCPPAGIPNTCTLTPAAGFRRLQPYSKYYPKGQLYQVDSIFAVFLMENKVFNKCTYGYMNGGEDYYWSLEAKKAGFESWMDSRFEAVHLYHKDV
jgi:hypothetical protein